MNSLSSCLIVKETFIMFRRRRKGTIARFQNLCSQTAIKKNNDQETQIISQKWKLCDL